MADRSVVQSDVFSHKPGQIESVDALREWLTELVSSLASMSPDGDEKTPTESNQIAIFSVRCPSAATKPAGLVWR